MTTALDDLVTSDLHDLATAAGHPRTAGGAAFRTAPAPSAGRSVALARWVAEVSSGTHQVIPALASLWARIVAGVAALVVSFLCWGWMLDPAAVYEPTYNIGGMAFLVAAAGGIAYLVARRRCARAMRQVPMDLERPDAPSPVLAWARAEAERLDGRATALTVLGLAVLMATSVYLLGGDVGTASDQRVSAVVLAPDSVLLSGLIVVLGGAFTTGFTWLVAKRKPSLRRWSANKWTLVSAVAMLWMAGSSASDRHDELLAGKMPDLWSRASLLVLLAGVIFSFTGWVAATLRARDRARLGLPS